MSEAHRLLSSVFGFEEFRTGQEEIVSAIAEGKDVFVIMPTGGGKSLCYQLPAMMGQGLTLVVSPLIALMQDQVAQLRQLGVEAAALSSANDPAETAAIYNALDDGSLKLLYIAPERLASGLPFLSRINVRLLVVDEAHCVSQWGHDFRPDYLRIGDLRRELGNVQTAAFTATADTETRADIAAKIFSPESPQVFLRGFDRPNLFLAFSPKNSPRKQILQFLKARKGQSGIIYCASRRKTESLAEALNREGFSALPYHAGMDPQMRQRHQERFTQDDGVIMTATLAFGMGIDKPDVRFVVHADMPKTIEAYYQEIGRAGRDGLPADTLTLFGLDDIKLRRLQIDESDAPETRKRVEHNKLNALLSLAEAPQCRRQTLLAYFDEIAPPCGSCDLCLNPPEQFDGTVAAQKALSAMLRTGERFGADHIVSVLRGEMTDRVVSRGHERLPTFGVGTEYDKGEWRTILRQVYASGFAAIDPEFGAWRVTEAGWRVLKGEETVSLRKDTLAAKSKTTRAADTPLDPVHEPILSALKAKRRELATAQGTPAYVIFPDRTLIELAERRPATIGEMADVHGVGAKKLERYGEIFLEVLAKAS